MFSDKEIAQVSPGETCDPGQICTNEKPPDSLSVPESRSDGVSGESRAEKMEMISQEKSLMLGDVFDGIDLQDSSVGNRHNDFFDDFELIINESEDFVPESCVNLFEALDVNDYGDDGMAKQTLDLVQNVAEEPNIATELQVDTVEGDKKVSEIIGSKAEEVESNEVISSGVLETSNEILARETELEKPVNSCQVLAASISQMAEDEDVEEGEISGDDNDDNMLIVDDLPVEKHEESHVSQEVFDQRGGGASSLFCGVGSLSSPGIVEEKEQRQIGKKLGVEVSNLDNGAKKSEQTSNNKEKVSEIKSGMLYCLGFLIKSDFYYNFVSAVGSWNLH